MFDIGILRGSMYAKSWELILLLWYAKVMQFSFKSALRCSDHVPFV